ncbi:hypothetical protein GH714_042365 [Hevea brasiliensis]|uniref:non-specific serine/threonine protein kinase n=1 Tax=Hevea brasiliensis TaxID=3981 RepID=A0A6A6KB44_HEVBR|nr:hypothetical protein GH714_042365 [Hevea brasiliensis]
MSFFIAPVDSQIPDNSSGGFLALFNNDTALNASKENQIIAVEFDSFKNAWDPDDNHVGILVNSIISVTNVTWNSSITNGSQANAWVSYNSTTRNLSVFLTYAQNPVFSGNSSLSYIVDLRDFLPEWVRVGFSASTGMSVELHNIISWDFDSSLEINQKARHKTGLLVCISVGLGIFACAVIGVFWLVFWRKRHGGRNEDEADDVSMDDEFEKGTGPKRFTFAELSRATSDFAESGKLGEGGFGGVYKGLLSESNTQIAVKKFSRGSKQVKRKWEQCVVHRDIKSSNVMLDSNFNAKLGDFGLARLVDHELGSQTTVLAGTMGYLAPECVTTGKSSKESDVYGFGVVALEITSGRRPVDTTQEPNKVRLVEWVWDLYGKGHLLEAVDKRLTNEFDERQLKCLMIVGLWCCHPDFAHRPSIRQVISVLNFEAPLPSLPAKLPVPIYYAPPMNLREFSSTSSGLTTSESSALRIPPLAI